MIFTAISVMQLAIYVVTDRIVSQLRLRCCRMGPTIYQRVMKLFLRHGISIAWWSLSPLYLLSN